jgi:LCP family protein required for cell wall assembly
VTSGPPPGEDRPQYKRYRARPPWLSRLPGGGAALEALRRREGAVKPGGERPPGERPRRGGTRFPGLKKPVTGRRVLKWLALGIAGWLGLSLILFLISAQIESGKISGAVDSELAGGFPLTSKETILVLGSDARVKGEAEPGAQTIGAPSRSDSILLLRTGGGAGAKLSIPRDTIVDIPGHGRNKINAAYAIGGVALAVRTIKAYLGIEINHVVEVDFANFPKLIDSMGGIDLHTGCIHSEINGGKSNGGKTLRLKAGDHHLTGEQALIIARTRKNECNPAENDLTRAKRQQQIMAAIKDRAISPWTFIRLPWVAWNAPKAVKSDRSGPSLLGLVGGLAVGGDGKTRILKPSGGETLPDGGAGLVVSEAEKRREVRAFLDG